MAKIAFICTFCHFRGLIGPLVAKLLEILEAGVLSFDSV